MSKLRRGGRGIRGDRRGKVKSRNMYKGPMDKDNREGRGREGRLNVGGRVGRAG